MECHRRVIPSCCDAAIYAYGGSRSATKGQAGLKPAATVGNSWHTQNEMVLGHGARPGASSPEHGLGDGLISLACEVRELPDRGVGEGPCKGGIWVPLASKGLVGGGRTSPAGSVEFEYG